MSEVDTYKIFRQLEERQKRANPYTFYDKDELIDEILNLEDKLEQKENIIKEVREKIKNHLYAKTILSDMYSDKEIFEFILEKTGDIDEQR